MRCRADLFSWRAAAHRGRAPLLAAVLFSGCFRYAPVQPVAVQPQEEVRLVFTEDAAIRLAREFGRITPQVEGWLEPRSPDTLLVSVAIGRHYPGTSFENVRQTVAVGRSELVEVRRRQLDVPRTAIASAGALVAFGYLVSRIFQQEDPNVPPITDVPPPPPDPAFVTIRVPFNFGWRH